MTQLVFKGSSSSRGSTEQGKGGPSGHEGGGQLVINIYLVSYWKENLQFVCHPLIQVVGLVVAKHHRAQESNEANLSESTAREKFIYKSHMSSFSVKEGWEKVLGIIRSMINLLMILVALHYVLQQSKKYVELVVEFRMLTVCEKFLVNHCNSQNLI